MKEKKAVLIKMPVSIHERLRKDAYDNHKTVTAIIIEAIVEHYMEK
jgi:predicted DNA-binding protein